MTQEEKIARLIEAGCENVYPKFIHGTDSSRAVVAEVVAGELLVYPDGEQLLVAQRPRQAKKKAPAEEPVVTDTPVAEESTSE